VRRPVEWGRREPESEPEPERLDTAPVDWHVVIRAAVDVALAEERRFNQAVLAEVVAEIRATTNDDLERAVRTLTVELSDLKATLAEVRLAFATDRTQALDLPNPLSKRADLNWGSMPDSRWLN
jgi:hypothetical protein